MLIVFIPCPFVCLVQQLHWFCAVISVYPSQAKPITVFISIPTNPTNYLLGSSWLSEIAMVQIKPMIRFL